MATSIQGEKSVISASERRVVRRETTPPPAPGFAGPGHTAVEVLTSRALAQSDPFVLLMDDRLAFGDGKQVGGAHPHAGLETVTLLLDGEVKDRDEGVLRAGDAVWMTAGRGIIHNEHVEASGFVRILQLWVTLPPDRRDAEPRFEHIPLSRLPIRKELGATARLYSGTTGTLSSPTQNHVPVTLVDFLLEPNASIVQELPSSYNGFVYVLEGPMEVGGRVLDVGDVGWLESPGGRSLRLRAGSQGGRAVLYAGEPQNAPIVQYGPFVAGSLQDIPKLYERYSKGTFTRMSSLRDSALS